MKSKTRSILTVCLALALVASAVLGTIAYMTAKDSKTNTFTVGSFNKPTDPDQPSQTLNSYILEKKWDATAEHKLIPGSSVDKDPKVGIGAGSEEAWVYVYVKNAVLKDTVTGKYVTFKLNDKWEAVEGQVVNGDVAGTYVSGLFKYKTTIGADESTLWTTTVFDAVDVSANANTTDFAENPQMTVYAFIHQAKDGNGAIDTATIQQAAITWSANPADN